MRVFGGILLCSVLILSGCAVKKEEVAAYRAAVRQNNSILTTFLESQQERNRTAQSEMMIHYSSAMSQAAKTPSNTDDVVIAFAFGFQSAKPFEVTLPDLERIQPPVTDVDRVRAWTPIVSMFVPFAQPLAAGLSGGYGDVTKEYYRVSGNGQINIDSGNVGSQNSAGGNQTNAVSTRVGYDSGEGEDGDELGIGTQSAAAETTSSSAPVSCSGYPGATFNGSTWYVDSTFYCSCQSRSEGRC